MDGSESGSRCLQQAGLDLDMLYMNEHMYFSGSCIVLVLAFQVIVQANTSRAGGIRSDNFFI